MRKTPIANRTIFCLTLLSVAPAAAQERWTEDDVTERARAQAVEVLAADARARLAEGEAQGAGLLPNPSVEWERQEAFAPNAQTQDIIRLVVPLDLSGRPATRRALAEVEARLSEAEAERVRLDAVAAARAAFHRALAAERRVAVLEAQRDALREALRVMESRRAAGEVSGYETARLAIGAQLAGSRAAQARIDADAARQQLAALFGAEPPDALEGELTPPSPPPIAALVTSAEARRPDLSALARADEAARRARAAADFSWVPRLSVEGGYNRQDGPLVGHGYAVGLSAEIPLFDHGQGERRAAEASAAVGDLRARYEARVETRIRVSHARLTRLLEERARFESESAEPVELLVRAATSGYQGGERSVVELLDARRAATEVAERRVALSLAARLAQIALAREAGGLR
ncbi:MAG: TolC family protein [Sandaracinaceae bacterium]